MGGGWYVGAAINLVRHAGMWVGWFVRMLTIVRE